jgi:hypothetical protein
VIVMQEANAGIPEFPIGKVTLKSLITKSAPRP